MLIEVSERKGKGSQPLVSVMIPAYRSGETLLCAIKSVLSQDYPNVQLIVCDDGTEGFDQIKLEEFLRTQERRLAFKVIHWPQNGGTVQNLNRSLPFAEGDWVMPLAADDALANQETLTHLMEQVRASGRRWIISKTGMCDENLERCGTIVPSEADIAYLNGAERSALYYRLCRDCFLPSSGAVYQRKVLDESGGFDPRYKLVEDWPLFLKLVRNGLIPEVSAEVCVFHRGGGVSKKHAGGNQDYQRDLIAVMENEILPHLGLLDADCQKKVRSMVRDKKRIFQYRFQCGNVWERLVWTIRNTDVIFRKIVGKLGMNDDF